MEEGKGTKVINVQYQPTYDELKEAIALLVEKRSKRSRRVVGCLWLIAALICLVLYIREPIGLHYAFGALVGSVTATLVWGYPDIKAAAEAKKILKKKGTYKLQIRSDGYVIPYGLDPLSLSEDKKSRAYETDRLFSIRPDLNHSIYLPKRAMDKNRIEFTRNILQTYCSSFTDCRKTT